MLLNRQHIQGVTAIGRSLGRSATPTRQTTQQPNLPAQRSATDQAKSKIRQLKNRIKHICDKIERSDDLTLEEMVHPRIIRWYREANRLIDFLPLPVQIERFSSDLSFLCGQLIDADLFDRGNRFTYRRLRNWHTQYLDSFKRAINKAIDARFESNPRLIDSPEQIQSVVDDLVAAAEEFNPLCPFYQATIDELVNRKASELIGDEETQRLREEALALLSEGQQRALGLLGDE